ncbi:MAG TPA: hypothetical protein VGA04_19340 [Streptosporangiaceae bacterium]
MGSGIEFGDDMQAALRGHLGDWPDWYAAYMVAEQAGTELPT